MDFFCIKIDLFKNCVNISSLYFIIKYNSNYVKYQYNVSKSKLFYKLFYLYNQLYYPFQDLSVFTCCLKLLAIFFISINPSSKALETSIFTFSSEALSRLSTKSVWKKIFFNFTIKKDFFIIIL